MRFKIGEKVVCTDRILGSDYARFVAAQIRLGNVMPDPGRVYTMRGGRMFYGVATGILLEELVNPQIRFADGWFGELHFNEELFAPVIKSKESAQVEALKRLADPSQWTHDDHRRLFNSPPMRKKEKAA